MEEGNSRIRQREMVKRVCFTVGHKSRQPKKKNKNIFMGLTTE